MGIAAHACRLASCAQTLFCVWTVMYTLPGLTLGFFKTTFGAMCLSVTYEVMRTHVMMNCAKMAVGALTPKVSAAYPVPFIGPFIAGLLGGCGGGFMPLDKGLSPVEKATNWRVQSAALGSLWLQLAMVDPYSVPY